MKRCKRQTSWSMRMMSLPPWIWTSFLGWHNYCIWILQNVIAIGNITLQSHLSNVHICKSFCPLYRIRDWASSFRIYTTLDYVTCRYIRVYLILAFPVGSTGNQQHRFFNATSLFRHECRFFKATSLSEHDCRVFNATSLCGSFILSKTDATSIFFAS